MEHKRTWGIIGKLSLVLLLFAVILVEIAMFISGPAIRYDAKIAAQKEVIFKQYESLHELDRHVFAYVIYSGRDDEKYYWFNERGELLTWRSLDDMDLQKVQAIAKQTYHMEDSTVSVGYGYKNPVYRLEDRETEVYLDIDTMEQVFIRKKGI